MLGLLQLATDAPIARKDPSQWQKFKTEYKLDLEPGIEFLLDPKIQLTLNRLQGEVKMLPCKIGIEISPFENIFLPRSCKDKRRLLAAIRQFTGSKKEETALEASGKLQLNISENSGKFTLDQETVRIVRNLEESPGNNPEIS